MRFAYTGQETSLLRLLLSNKALPKFLRNTALILHKQLRCCHEKGGGREAEGNGYPTSTVLFWPFLGRIDKSYGQGDTSPKKLSVIIWTQDLFLLWTGLKHSRVGLAGITDSACFPPLRAERNLYKLSLQQEPGFLLSPLPQPLAVLIYTMRLAPSLHCIVYKAIILFQFTL